VHLVVDALHGVSNQNGAVQDQIDQATGPDDRWTFVARLASHPSPLREPALEAHSASLHGLGALIGGPSLPTLHVREAESAACYGDAARQPNPDISQPSIRKGVLEESRGAATLILAGLRGLRARTGALGQRIPVASGAWLRWMENLAERLKRGCKDRLVGTAAHDSELDPVDADAPILKSLRRMAARLVPGEAACP
jgi:hypothetical protein